MSQYQVRTGPIQNNAATFSPEMVQGSAPPRNRSSHAGIGKQLGQTIPTLGIDFAFDSVLASRLDSRNRLTKPQHLPSLSQTTQEPDAVMASMTIPSLTGVPSPRNGQPIFIFSQDFAFESVLASRLDNRYRLTKPQPPPPISQTTHVPAAFTSSMVETPATSPRLKRGRQIELPQWSQVFAFAFESVLGSCLDSRLHQTKPRHWIPFSETTPVPAAFTPSMTEGVTAPRPRILRPRQIELPQWVNVAAFSFESVLASRLDNRYRLTRPQHLAPISQPTHVQNPFSLEMVSRVLDLRSRQGKPRHWEPFSQTTHVPAAFTISMTAGHGLPQPRILRPRQIELPQWVNVAAFAFESVFASRLDQRYRLTKPQHLAPISQPTHVAAPFSIEMVSRVLDLRTRQVKPRQNSQQDLVIVPAFAFESVLGGRLDLRSHLARALQIGQPEVVNIADFAFESMIGNLDRRNHLRNPYHVAPISQTTHIAAPITPDMFRGHCSIPPQLKNSGIFLFYYTSGNDMGVAVILRMICGRLTITPVLAADALSVNPTLEATQSVFPTLKGTPSIERC